MSSLKYTLTIVAAVLVGSAPGQAESDSPLSDRLPSDRTGKRPARSRIGMQAERISTCAPSVRGCTTPWD